MGAGPGSPQLPEEGSGTSGLSFPLLRAKGTEGGVTWGCRGGGLDWLWVGPGSWGPRSLLRQHQPSFIKSAQLR